MSDTPSKPVRPDLAQLRERLATTSDAGRPEAVARRRKTGQRTARENIADLVDPDSFIEYGGLALAAQRSTRSVEDLVRTSPADGLVCGVGTVNRALFDEERARTLVTAYDYTVFAGTQGLVGHRKLDRMFALAAQGRLPVVLFAEGGGGRPNDTDTRSVAGLDTPSFLSFAALSGLVPRVGIASGRCFAGNAALLGCCDVIIATDDSNIGKQLEAIEDPAAREQMAQEMIAEAHRRGQAINMASLLELDAVIDPAETRAWLLRGLRSAPRPAREGRRRFIDTW